MFPKRLEQLRLEKDLTHQQMANTLGITRQAYGNYESGKRQPDFKTLQKLADYFDVTTDYLLGRTDDPTDRNNEAAIKIIQSAVSDDPELLEFWGELSQREDLQLLFKQVKPMTPEEIKKVMRIIKAIEDEPQEIE